MFSESAAADSYAFAGESDWDDYSYRAQVKALGSKDCGLYFRVQDTDNLYMFRAGLDDKAQIWKKVSGTFTKLAEETYKTNLKQWYTLEVKLSGTSIKCYVDGSLAVQTTNSQFSEGKIGLRAEGHAHFDSTAVSGIPVFADDFSSSSGKWTVVAGTWEVTSGYYKGSGSGNEHYALGGNPNWINFVYEADVKGDDPDNWDGGLVFRAKDENNLYFFRAGYDGKAQLYKRVSGTFTQVAEKSIGLDKSAWHNFMVEANDIRIRCFVDGNLALEVYDTTFSKGKVGFRVSNSQTMKFDDVYVCTVPNFKDGFADGAGKWSTSGSATWSVTDEQKYKAVIASGYEGYSFAGDLDWKDYKVSARVNCQTTYDAGVVFRAQDSGNWYMFRVGVSGLAELYRRQNSQSAVRLDYSSYDIDEDEWHTLEIIVKGDKIRCYVDNLLQFTVTDSTFTKGKIGLRIADGTALFDEVKVSQLIADDDFSSYTGSSASPPWTVLSGNWSVSSGEYTEDESGSEKYALIGNTYWCDYTVEADIIYQSGGGSDGGLLFWAKDINDFFMFRPYYSGNGKAGIYQKVSGSFTTIREVDSVLNPTGTHTLKVECYGDTIHCYVDKVLFITESFKVDYKKTSPRSGKAGLAVSSNSHVHFDNVRVSGRDNSPMVAGKSYTSIFPRQSTPASEIDTIDIINSDAATRMLVTTLQGIVNRTQPRLYVDSFKSQSNDGYLDYSDSDEKWRDVLDDDGYTFTTRTVAQLVSEYDDEVSGAIIYDPALFDDPDKMAILNVVITLCGVKNAIALTASQNDTYGFTVLVDTRDKWSTSLEAYKWAYENLWPQCDHHVLGLEHPSRRELTDYFVANKIFVSFVEENEESKALFEDLLAEMPPLSSVLGVWDIRVSKETRLSGSHSSGTTTLNVDSTEGLGLAEYEHVCIGSSNEEFKRVNSVSDKQIVLKSGLSNNQPDDAVVIKAGICDYYAKLGQAYNAGSTNLLVDSSSGFYAGDHVFFNSGSYEYKRIASVPDSTHIVLTAGLSNAQAANTPINRLVISRPARLASAHSSGATTLTLDSAAGIRVGDYIYVGLAHQEYRQVTAVTSNQVTIASGLSYNQPAGAHVTKWLWTDPHPYSPWCEFDTVRRTSGKGLLMQVAWMCTNLSLWSGTSQASIGSNESITYSTKADDRVYLTFVLSDGDNLAVCARQRQYQFDDSYRGDVYLGYTFSPTMYDLAPRMLEYFYDNLNDEDYILSMSGIGYMHCDVYGNAYSFDQEKIWDNYLAMSGQYLSLAGDMEVIWPLLTNLGDATNYSLERICGTPNIVGAFHDYFPNPTSYNGTIHTYNSIPAFREVSIPDLSTIDANYYQDTYNNPGNGWNRIKYRISYNVNSVTPTDKNRVYLFCGISGFGFGPSAFFSFTDGNGVYHKSLWELIIARSNFQYLIGEDYSICNLRPDDFIHMYLASPSP